MKRLVEFPLEDGGSIVVEVDEPGPETGFEQVSRPGEIAEKAGQTFEVALEKIRPAAVAIVAKLIDLPRRPDEITVQFRIKLGGQVGAFVASADAEANYAVTLTWRKPASPPAPKPAS
jgi:Trypsin-co-occurring domain 1